MRSLGVDAVRQMLARAPDGQPRVLPRFLRRPARLLSRMEWQAPRHLGLKGVAVLFLGTAVTGMISGGHTDTVLSAVTAGAGLSIDQVKITGQSETSETDVLDRLAMGPYPSLLMFDIDAARERVEALPWVAEATLRKLYPDTLEVALTESTPFALWQHDNQVSLIDEKGAVISDYISERYTRLPLVVGAGANERVAEFADLLEVFPALKARVRAGVLVSQRRWNIVLGEAIEIMLPQDNPKAALARVAELDADSQLLSRDIAAVDLRLPDRLVVRLTEKASVARAAMLKEREKIARKRGANI